MKHDAKQFRGVEVDKLLKIKGKIGHGTSIAIAERDSIETYCSGSGRYGQDFPVNPDMLFQAGSVSKPMFALTLLRYVDKGLIDLDADISTYVKEYAKIPITFAALLSHTAGFNLHGFPGYPAAAPLLTLEDVLNGKGVTPKLRRMKPYGKQHWYSGGGYTLAELAFTRITGMTLQEAFAKEVADPLGLTRTGYFQPLDESMVFNAAFGGRLAKKEDAAHGYHYYPEHAAAGLWTTPSELTKIGIELGRSIQKGGLLKKETALRMVTPVMGKYGLGIYNLRGDIAYHDGWNEGFVTTWMFSMREDLCAAGMLNISTDELDWALTNTILKLFQDKEEELCHNAEKVEWASYCGSYEHIAENFHLDEVFLQNEKLFGKSEEDTYQLYAIGENEFGQKGGFHKIIFDQDCLIIDGVICRKVETN